MTSVVVRRKFGGTLVKITSSEADGMQTDSQPHFVGDDLLSEALIPLREAVKLVPLRQGKPVNVSTMFRWVSKGISNIRLEYCQIGGSVELESKDPIKSWGKRMERMQGRGRVWIETARRDAGLAH